MKEIVKDQKQRDQIKNDVDKNIFVEAGAGSGKTASLVSRMVSMVKKGIDISKISAITFTKAAAVEFYNRFEEELSNVINSDISDDEKKLCEKALLDIDLCFLGTIDAFCNMVLSENPIEAGIPLNANIIDEDEYNFLITNEYSYILENIDPKDEPLLKAFLRFQINPKDAFTTCAKQLLSRRNYYIDVKEYKDIKKAEEEFYAKYKQEIKILVKNIIKDDYEYVYDGNGKSRLARDYLKDNLWVMNDKWNKRPSLIMNFIKKGLLDLCLLPTFPYQTTSFNDYYEIGKARSGQIYKPKDKFKEILQEYQTIQYDYSIAFISKCLDLISKDLIKKGKLSFFDNLLLFRDLLKNDAKNGGELIKRISDKHTYYLIDEFQDTDPLQAEIIFYLTAEKPVEDFTLCKPKKGTLFIVGDPKQSIYRFRNADVVSYNFIKGLFDKNKDLVLSLTSNFRTHEKLINYFNAEFDVLFNNEESSLQAHFESVDYVDDVPKRKKALVDGVYKYISTPDDDHIKVSNIIRNLVNKGYDYGDFMVLTSTKSKLEKYMNQFDKDYIPYEIVGKSVFEECEPFIKISYLFGALAYPHDSYYVYKAIKFLFKYSDDHIYSIFNEKDINLDNELVDASINKLVSFVRDNTKEDIIYVFDKAIEEFSLIKQSSIKHLEYLYYAKELLRNEISSGRVITFKDAYNYLFELKKSKDVEKSLSLSNETIEKRVLLANVHKVKGLERRIVILTSNGSKAESSSSSKVKVHSSYDEKKNYIIKIEEESDDYIKYAYVETNEYEDKRLEEGRALDFEKERIAYVAATRACDALFISSNSLNKDGKNVAPWGMLIKDDSIKQFIIEDDSLTFNLDKDHPKEVNINDLNTSVISFNENKFKDKTYSIVSPSKLINIIDDESHAKGKSINKDASLKGTIIHRLMELFVSSGFSDDLSSYLNMINNEFDLNNEFDSVLTNIYNTMKNGGFDQENGFDKNLISILKDADEIYCELPFAYKEDSNIYNGIIDLLYRKGNEWVIVDYKTNYDPKELDKKYENQLEAYKKALLTQGIEAKAFIYHINTI